MSDNLEPKPSIEQMVDAALNPVVEQQAPSSVQTEQPTEVPGSGSDPLKTQQPETDAVGTTPKRDPIPYEKFSEVWNQHKEARELLKQKEAEAKRYAQLLDEFQKRQATQQGSQKEATAQSIAEKACKKLGWDISRLNQEQQAYIKDHVDLTMAAVEDYVKDTLDKRLAPFEQSNRAWEAQQLQQKAEARWGELAKEDGLDVKLVQTAINNYCLDLDKRDPERTIQLSDEDLYFRATRQLLRERETSQTRQEARTAVKANARPLGQSPQAQVADAPGKPQKPIDFLEKQLDSLGIR